MSDPMLAKLPPSRQEAPPVAPALPAELAVDLSGARVAVLGCGSVGGLAAWCLTSAGVTRLELADRDVLEADNLRRHVCGDADLGQRKAEAVAGFLRGHHAGVTATSQHGCFLDKPELLRGLLERCDVALAAVDDETPKHLIDAMARELGRAVVYAGVYGDGWAAEVILSDPTADTPCYACTARALGRIGVRVEAATGPAYAQPVAGMPPSAWPRADLTSLLPCAALAVRLVTDWLARQRGQDAVGREFLPADGNAWRLALRRVPAWGFGPWELRPAHVSRQPGCPECGGRRASLTDFTRLITEVPP